MKKTILSIVMTIVVVLFVVGCGSPKLKNETNLDDYLSKTYEYEEFEKVGKEKKDLTVKGKKVEGYVYKVKSKKSDVKFTVEDVYEDGEYKIVDDYVRQALYKYIDYKEEKRFIVDESITNSNHITINIDAFEDVDDLVYVLYDFVLVISEQPPFYNEDAILGQVSYYLYNNDGDYLDAIHFNEISAPSDIRTMVEKVKK